jgi:hypothetical protein
MNNMADYKDTRHLDANETVFFKRELEYVKSRAYDTKYRENKLLSILPISTEAGPGATEITWRRYTSVGSAIQISDSGKNIPRADVYGEETTTKIVPYGSSYGWNVFEIRRAQMAGKPLEAMRGSACRKAIDDKLNDIAANGDTANGLGGFINRTDVSTYTVVSGTSGLKTWANKTSDEILADMNGIVNAVVVATVGIERPNTLLLPQSNYNLIMQKRLGDGSDETIMSYFKKTNEYIKTIDWVYELTGAGTAVSNRMIAFVNDSEHLEFALPIPFEQHDVEKDGFDYVVPCTCSTTGMIVFYPASVIYGDGV